MGKLFTWFDIETTALRKKYENLWPESIVGVNVYPDELQVRIRSEENREQVSAALKEWFGVKYNKVEQKIYLEAHNGSKKRFMQVSFEIVEAGEERIMPDVLKPNFQSFSLYPDTPALKGPDLDKMVGQPLIWAFYSFKGGVSRTLHLISLVKALSEQEPPLRTLIVDADLEAPGLTWWAKEQLGEAEISFLDFLALAHYDDQKDYSTALAITAEQLRQQRLIFETRERKVEHFFLPAFREIDQLMRMPIRPENLCWESGKEWLLPELLWKLGKVLNVHAVMVDLRAGLSEISSPVLFDPRVNRVVVTTSSGQSIEGTKQVLAQVKKISNTLNTSEYDAQVPTVVISMIKGDRRRPDDLASMTKELTELVLPGGVDNDEITGKQVVFESLFDENLLNLKNLSGTLDKLDGTNMHELMTKIAEEWILTGTADKALPPPDVKTYKSDLDRLKKTADDYKFAESGKAKDFLITPSLRKIARKFETSLPAAVIMGPKGSGKTYTYLQLANLKNWGRFIKKVEGKDKTEAPVDFGSIWPLLTSGNLQDEAGNIVAACRQDVENETKGRIFLKKFSGAEIEDRIALQKKEGRDDKSSWRKFWLRLMADSLSCEQGADPLEGMQKALADIDTGIVFLVDGLEDHFQGIADDPVEQAAVSALCTSVVDAIREWPDNKIGLLIFVRKDLVKSSITYNFAQFEDRYKSIQLNWNREEALRLVAWLVKDAARLKGYVDLDGKTPIEKFSREAIEKALEGLWGLKLGPSNSREAYTANWVIAALSDFNGQLQARDIVRLISHAAQNALQMDRYRDRLLPPPAIKNALDPCSKEKIDEIEQEITVLKGIFEKLRNAPAPGKQVPFDLEAVDLEKEDIRKMKRLGIVMEHEGGYYLPEIIRRGLGFSFAGRGRLRVLNMLKRALGE
ncbi:MAG: hypothetical protein KAW12_24075 [Candidatus Aminicenantes bacterium]|nr:hypothetical protein [Candidatus Aminicenantes bacterium]